MELKCKNHPDREAKRKCFFCKENICSTCQINISNHIFCSKKCYWFFIGNRFYISVKILVTNLLIYLRKKKLLSWRTLFDLVLILGVLLGIKLSIDSRQLTRQLKDMQTKKTTTDREVPYDSILTKIDTLTVFSPPPGTMVLQNRFDVEGETEGNRIVSLSADGKLLQVTIAKDGRFAFKDIRPNLGQNHFVIRSFEEDGSSIILQEIKYIYGKPSFSFLAKDFVRGNPDEKHIALTFDGGSSDNAAHEILDILKQEQLKATFFLTGAFIKRYPELVKRMANEGHIIGNHTWSHPHLTTFMQNQKHITLSHISPELIREELLRTAELYRSITGREMASIWRAPFGEHNYEIRLWAAEAGFRHVGWTVGRSWEDGMDTLDWVADKSSPNYHTAQEVAEKILAFGNSSKYGANGAVILMHLGTLRTDDYPHQKLPMIIDQFKKRGFQFKTILEML